jgi:hypothetical protein
MPDRDRIIVLQQFDNAIDANIIKAKLDAYGIPCFLSSENMTSLTTHFLSGGVRLHIFEQDREQVLQVLTEEVLHKSDEDDLVRCPRCRSKKVLTLAPDRFAPASVVKFMLQLDKSHYCVDCQNEFD